MFGLVTDRNVHGNPYRTRHSRWHPVEHRNAMTPCGFNAAAFPAEAFADSLGRVACVVCCPTVGTPATDTNPTLFDLPPTPGDDSMTTDLTRPGDAALHVTAALSDGQRARIIDRFCYVNPNWQGANADDILLALDDADAHLDQTEPWWETHVDDVMPRGWSLRLVNLALLALIRADSPAGRWKAPTFEAVAELVQVVIERVGADG